MKLISAKNEKQKKSLFIKKILRDLLIVSTYTCGFALYAFVYLAWTVDFNQISVAWVTIPLIGFSLGIIHLIYIYKGSLICRTITMLSILLYVFVLPVIIAIVN